MARSDLAPTIERRIAMVIGNSAYRHAGVLKNPVNDARAMARVLGRLGFEVIQGANLGLEGIGDALGEFESRLHERPDVALLYYAGHGLQVDGRNYLVPIDVQISQKTHLSTRAVLLSDILDEMAASASTSLLFLDACRENPFSENIARSLGQTGRSMSVRGGLAPMERAGTFIAYATAPDHLAFDGAGQNSPFTSALLQHIEMPGLSVGDMMIDVRNKVIAETKGKQQPWDQSSLRTRFSFVPDPAAGAAPPTTVANDTAAADQSNAGPRAFRTVSRSMIVAAAGFLGAVGLGFLAWTKLGGLPTGTAPQQVVDIGNVSVTSVDRASSGARATPLSTASTVDEPRPVPLPADSTAPPLLPAASPSIHAPAIEAQRAPAIPAEVTQFGPNDFIHQLAVSKSGKLAAIAATDNGAVTVAIYNIATGERMKLLSSARWQVQRLIWGASDDTLSVFARAQGGSEVTQFHVASGEQKLTLRSDRDIQILMDGAGVLKGAIYPGEQYPSKVQNGVLQSLISYRPPIWDPYRLDEFGFFKPTDGSGHYFHDSPLKQAMSCGSGAVTILYLAQRDLVVWPGRKGCFLVWNLETMKPVRIVDGGGFTDPTAGIASADGQLIAIGTQSGAVHIWDTNSWKELRRLQASAGRITRLAFSPDGRHLVTTGDVDGTAKVWDVLTGSNKAEFLHIARNAIGPLAVTPDGATLLTTGYHVKKWKMPN